MQEELQAARQQYVGYAGTWHQAAQSAQNAKGRTCGAAAGSVVVACSDRHSACCSAVSARSLRLLSHICRLWGMRACLCGCPCRHGTSSAAGGLALTVPMNILSEQAALSLLAGRPQLRTASGPPQPQEGAAAHAAGAQAQRTLLKLDT